MTGGCDDHQLLVERSRLVERRIGDRLGDQRGIELAGEDRGRQHVRIAGAQLQSHLRMAPVIFAERAGQADRRGALHRAEAEQPARALVLHGAARLIGEREQPVGVVEQHAAGGREMQALSSRRNSATPSSSSSWRMRVVTFDCTRLSRRGGTRDAAFADDDAEDAQGGEIMHLSLR